MGNFKTVLKDKCCSTK